MRRKLKKGERQSDASGRVEDVVADVRRIHNVMRDCMSECVKEMMKERAR